MFNAYKKLLLKRRLTPSLFLIEIVEKLHEKHLQEIPFGIAELYESLSHPKPTFSSFRAKLLGLQLTECIEIKVSKEKASKKSVVLSEKFYKQIVCDVYGEG
ncbi:hypothetical protein N9X39_00740 [Alphaproteobacteria bacterium]|nr:hypothetical protein [Alphaproteobacteria bacterium]